MPSEKFLAAVNAINALTADELNELVPYWKAASKNKRAVQAVAIATENKFRHGDVLSWLSTRGRTRGQRFYFKFEKMNRAGTCAQGPQCSKDGAVFGGTCTVAPMYIDSVNGKLIK